MTRFKGHRWGERRDSFFSLVSDELLFPLPTQQQILRGCAKKRAAAGRNFNLLVLVGLLYFELVRSFGVPCSVVVRVGLNFRRYDCSVLSWSSPRRVVWHASG